MKAEDFKKFSPGEQSMILTLMRIESKIDSLLNGVAELEKETAGPAKPLECITECDAKG